MPWAAETSGEPSSNFRAKTEWVVIAHDAAVGDLFRSGDSAPLPAGFLPSGYLQHHLSELIRWTNQDELISIDPMAILSLARLILGRHGLQADFQISKHRSLTSDLGGENKARARGTQCTFTPVSRDLLVRMFFKLTVCLLGENVQNLYRLRKRNALEVANYPAIVRWHFE